MCIAERYIEMYPDIAPANPLLRTRFRSRDYMGGGVTSAQARDTSSPTRTMSPAACSVMERSVSALIHRRYRWQFTLAKHDGFYLMSVELSGYKRADILLDA